MAKSELFCLVLDNDEFLLSRSDDIRKLGMCYKSGLVF